MTILFSLCYSRLSTYLLLCPFYCLPFATSLNPLLFATWCRRNVHAALLAASSFCLRPLKTLRQLRTSARKPTRRVSEPPVPNPQSGRCSVDRPLLPPRGVTTGTVLPVIDGGRAAFRLLMAPSDRLRSARSAHFCRRLPRPRGPAESPEQLLSPVSCQPPLQIGHSAPHDVHARRTDAHAHALAQRSRRASFARPDPRPDAPRP